jgi:hypothetical protein
MSRHPPRTCGPTAVEIAVKIDNPSVMPENGGALEMVNIC